MQTLHFIMTYDKWFNFSITQLHNLKFNHLENLVFTKINFSVDKAMKGVFLLQLWSDQKYILEKLLMSFKIMLKKLNGFLTTLTDDSLEFMNMKVHGIVFACTNIL